MQSLFLLLNLMAALGLAGLFFGLPRRRDGRGPGLAGTGPVRRDPLARRRWSPYAAGAGLGLVAVLSLWLAGHPLGASSAFRVWAGDLLRLLDHPLAQSRYFGTMVPVGWPWQGTLLVGVLLGALLSASASGEFRLELTQTAETTGSRPALWPRWAAAFAGGLLVELGASLAGGCTSGLAIAGSAQLSPAGFLFIGSLFATGILTARLLHGRNTA